MDIPDKLIDNIKDRLGYKDEVTITRDEFNFLTGTEIWLQKELQEEIEGLNDEISELKDEVEEANDSTESLQKKLDKILEIVEG